MGLLDIFDGMQNGPRGQQQLKQRKQRRHVADHDELSWVFWPTRRSREGAVRMPLLEA